MNAFTVGFWNIYQGRARHMVGPLADQFQVDILVLAEDNDVVATAGALNASSQSQFFSEQIAPGKLSVFSRLPSGSVVSLRDDFERATFKSVSLPSGAEILLVGVHLPSKMYMSAAGAHYHARILRELIEETELQLGHARTLVMGDFNMSPFELGMIAADGMHGVSDRQLSSTLNRKILNRAWSSFYNPMWSLMGDFNQRPPGSYFYRDGNPDSQYWHLFDQVLLRPELAFSFSEKVLIPTSIGRESLIKGKIPNKAISDHLPVIVSLNL